MFWRSATTGQRGGAIFKNNHVKLLTGDIRARIYRHMDDAMDAAP